MVTCTAADRCGGCALIGLPEDEQLARKRQTVQDAFGPGFDVDPCVAAPRNTSYRNRAKLAAIDVDGRVRLGLHRRGTSDVVDLAPCRVHSERLQGRLEALRCWLERTRLARPAGPVRAIDLREARDGAVHVTLVLECGESDRPELALDDLARSVGPVAGVACNFNPTGSSYVFGETTRTAVGERTFFTDSPVSFEVPATGFFQVSTDLLDEIHARMVRHLDLAGGPLYDLYCGVGVHGIRVAGMVARGVDVRGVESSASAAACARRNAHRFRVRARYATGPVERIVTAWTETQPGSVILNPGRAGCRGGVIEWVSRYARAGCVYLSCNPTTLARDAARLTALGFRAARITPFDLMPQTDQVETLVSFELA